MHTTRWGLVLGSVMVVSGCGSTGDEGPAGPADASQEGGTAEASPEAAVDSAIEAAADSGKDAADAAAETGKESGTPEGAVVDGELQFVGDWETQDASQWSNKLFPSEADQFQIVTSPLRQGSHAARFTVRPGDKYKTFSGQRAEVSLESRADLLEGEGDELFYGWSTYFPEDWAEPKGWAIFCQWHAFTNISPPIGFRATNEGISVDFNAGDITGWWPAEYGETHAVTQSLEKGKWNDFIVRIKWRPDWTGALDVWHRVEGQGDFVLALALKDIPTLQWSTSIDQFWDAGHAQAWGEGWYSKSYLQYGFYRGDEGSITNVVYQDGFARGTGFGVIRNRFD